MLRVMLIAFTHPCKWFDGIEHGAIIPAKKQHTCRALITSIASPDGPNPFLGHPALSHNLRCCLPDT